LDHLPAPSEVAVPGEVAVKYVLFYEPNPAGADKIRQHFPAHREKWAQFQAAGTLLMVGPFTDGSGALGVFTTREAAEEFAKTDPFVLNGVVTEWSIREWNEAIFRT
jgi:uncharacterized protein